MIASAPRTKTFKLSLSQARYYCRKPECAAVTDMKGYAAIIERAGIRILAETPNSLELEAGQGEVWTALSGLSW